MASSTTTVEPLITALLDNTRKGLLSWVPQEGSQQWFEFRGPSTVITVGSRDGDGLPPFVLVVDGLDGNAPDRFVDLDSSTDLPRLFHIVKDLIRGGTTASETIRKAIREQAELAGSPAH